MFGSIKSAFLCIGAAIVLHAVSASAQMTPAETLASGLPVSGQSVILGTWTWDIESNFQGRSDVTDIWWQQMDDVRQALVPRSGAAIAVVRDRSYYDITAEDLMRLRYFARAVPNTLIVPDAVLAIRTAEGNYAKIRVIGYRDLHDLSFDDAKYAHDRWKCYLRTVPNRPNYHLEVEWTLYPASPVKL